MEQAAEKAVVFLPWNTIEREAQQQILNTASMPFVFKHVAVIRTVITARVRPSVPCCPPTAR